MCYIVCYPKKKQYKPMQHTILAYEQQIERPTTTDVVVDGLSGFLVWMSLYSVALVMVRCCCERYH